MNLICKVTPPKQRVANSGNWVTFIPIYPDTPAFTLNSLPGETLLAKNLRLW